MKQSSFLMALLLLLTFASCGKTTEEAEVPDTNVEEPDVLPSGDETTDRLEPQPEPWVWPVDTPENQGVSAQALEALHVRFDGFPLLSSVIVRNGRIIDTYYKSGYDENSLFVLNSASKSVTSMLFGQALDMGYIESVDAPIAEYIPRVAGLADERWQRVTLRHLLPHTSGLASTDSSRWGEWRSSENWMEYIFALPFEHEPGTRFDYSTANTHMLSAVIESATGMSLGDFARQYLFDPLDIESARIDLDPQGVSDGGNGVWMTTADMARLGQLFLQKGRWEGEQIVPESWVEASTTMQFDRNEGSADYGYCWWVRTFGDERYPAYFAQGHAGQYIFVVPQLELTVAFNSDYIGSTGIYWQLMNDIVAACGPSE